MSVFKETACGSCGQRVRYIAAQAGQVAPCPKCGRSLKYEAVNAAAGGISSRSTNLSSGRSSAGSGQPSWIDDVRSMANELPESAGSGTSVPIGLSKPSPVVSSWEHESADAETWAAPTAAPAPRRRSALLIGSALAALLALGGGVAFLVVPGMGGSGVSVSNPVAASGSKQGGSPSKSGGNGSSGDNAPEPAKQPEAPPKNGEPPEAEAGRDELVPQVEPPEESTSAVIDPKRKIADQVEVESGVERKVFVSSIIGMEEIDRKFFEHSKRKESFSDFCKVFVERDDNDGPTSGMEWYLMELARVQHSAVWDARPMFTVNFPSERLAEGVRVGVYLTVPDEYQKFLPTKDGVLVSKTDSVPLATDVSEETRSAVDFNDERNRFEVQLDLPWNLDELRKLDQELKIPLGLKVVYADKSFDEVRAKVLVEPGAELEHYPLYIQYGVAVDPKHPWVRRLIDQINQDPENVRQKWTLSGGGADDPAASALNAFLVWKALASRGIRYQNLTAAEMEAQRVRPIHESLDRRNANCADGSVLFASFLEAMGMNPMLIFVHRHVYVGLLVKDGEQGFDILPIETTLLGENAAREREIHQPAVRMMCERFPGVRNSRYFWSFVGAVEANYLEIKDWKVSGKEVTGLQTRFNESCDALAAAEASGDRAAINAALEQCMKDEFYCLFLRKLRAEGVRSIGAPPSLGSRYKFPDQKQH
jgi:hypothetical protein